MRFRSGKPTSYPSSRVRPNTKKALKEKRPGPVLAYILIGAAAAVSLAAGLYFSGAGTPTSSVSRPVSPAETTQTHRPAAIKIAPPSSPPIKAACLDDPWEGPILYHSPKSAPIHLILVEKAIQKLHLYRYDGNYHRIKTYNCGTGERKGQKQVENDEKTPEGIYFNTKIYRDRNITVFGDRAFELNYPNAFDNIAGRGGRGIYIHGSNRKVTPYSTNGCVALDNQDLKDLDKRIEFDKTPIIIGERLPYTFSKPKRDTSRLVNLFRQAMIPGKYVRRKIDFPGITILSYKNNLVSFGAIQIKSTPSVSAVSRLYLAEPDRGFMVLVKREWREKKPARTVTEKAPAATREKEIIAALVRTWETAWENKHLEAYIAHYHPDFIGNGKNLAEWKRYKNRLNRKYKKISVTVTELKTRTKRNTSRAWFKQRYRSDAFKSDGYKVLEFRKKDNKWKIFREKSFSSKPKNWPA